MEADKNPIPPIDLFPRLAAVGNYLARLIGMSEPRLSASDHYVAEHFTEPVLTEAHLVRGEE